MVDGVVGCVQNSTEPTPSSLNFAMDAAIWVGSICWVTLGDGEKGVGAGVLGIEELAIPSSPPRLERPSSMASGWRVWWGYGLDGFGVGAGVAGMERARSALSLERDAVSWSGEGALCPARAPPVLKVGVGAGVEGAAGDRTELVELVRLRMVRSIIVSRKSSKFSPESYIILIILEIEIPSYYSTKSLFGKICYVHLY